MFLIKKTSYILIFQKLIKLNPQVYKNVIEEILKEISISSQMVIDHKSKFFNHNI
ncbi:hypothetical protein pb186bvf_015972 [Paramecium bursaria]